jgi:hypothetical protein
MKKPAKVRKVMGEYKRGTLKSSSGSKVKSRKQAVAIAMSEAGMKRNKKDDDKGRGNKRSVSPQAALYVELKPKKNVRMAADEWERVIGSNRMGKPRNQAKAYRGSLTTGGSGDPTKKRRRGRPVA